MFNKENNQKVLDVIQNLMDNVSSKVQQLPDGGCVYQTYIDSMDMPIFIEQASETIDIKYTMYDDNQNIIVQTDDMFILALCFINYVEEKGVLSE